MPETNKRLEQLRKQVYGKQEFKAKNESTGSADITYLRQDLTKIAIISSLTLSIQFALYFVFKNNLLNISI